MIPKILKRKIPDHLFAVVGARADVGKFLVTFSSLERDRDIEYALDELNATTDETYKKAIRLILRDIRRHRRRYPNEV